MEPTEHNRRAWDEIHRQRAQVLAGERGLPSPVRHALADLIVHARTSAAPAGHTDVAVARARIDHEEQKGGPWRR